MEKGSKDKQPRKGGWYVDDDGFVKARGGDQLPPPRKYTRKDKQLYKTTIDTGESEAQKAERRRRNGQGCQVYKAYL